MPAVKIRKRTGGGDWDTLYQQTTVDKIKLNASGDPLSDFSSNILQVSNATVTGVGAPSFVKVATNGTLSFRTGTQLRQDIGASSVGHSHTIEQVTNLDTTLAAKADLNLDGVIPVSQIPDYLFSGLKFAGTAGGASTDTLGELITAANTALGASTDLQREGAYFVASSDFELGAGSGTHTIIGGGDEGDEVLPITLEKGDWIVYLGYNGTAHEWSIVNNTYRNAEVSNVTGVVALSPGTIETRAALSQT